MYEERHGIQLTAHNQLDYLDFADELPLLSHTHTHTQHEQMKMKITSVAETSASVGLIIHREESKILKYNTENTNPISLDVENLEEVGSFTYLDSSTIYEQGGPYADVKTKTGKSRAAFLQLNNVWNSKHLSTNTKV